MQVSQRLRADFDPDQFDQFGIGVNDTLDAVGDRGCIRGEKTGIEAAHPAGRRDGARDQIQARRVGQQTGVAEWLPDPAQFCDGALGPASKAEAGLLAGFADGGDRQRPRPRRLGFGAALEQVGLDDGVAAHRVIDVREEAGLLRGRNEGAGHFVSPLCAG